MTVRFQNLPPRVIADLKIIGREALSLGFRAYLVGGVVRDLLLKRGSQDLDIVVEGSAIDLAKALVRDAGAKVTVYEQFKTATVVFKDGRSFDFATARSETYPSPGALPVVRPGAIHEDLFRRDFTVNAMAMALDPDRFGLLVDPYGGEVDLVRRSVRVLHEKSFEDDPTRILRAIRFETRFGFRCDAKTAEWLRSATRRRLWATVKLPRFFAEFRKFFAEDEPLRPLRRFLTLGGKALFPFPYFLKTGIFSKLQVSARALKKNPFYKDHDWSTVYFLAFALGAQPQDLHSWARQAHLTARELSALDDLVAWGHLERQLRKPGLKPSQIYELLDPVDLEIIYFIRAATSVNIVARRIDDFLQRWRLVALTITGHDLLKIGVRPGKGMGAMLRALLARKIDGHLPAHRDEVAAAREMMKEF